ncbi:hypothetical protein [Lacunimicrobium album]
MQRAHHQSSLMQSLDSSKTQVSLTILLSIATASCWLATMLVNSVVIKCVLSSIAFACFIGFILLSLPYNIFSLLVKPPYAALLFLMSYSFIGLLPLSQYRDYLDREYWLINICLAISGFVCGILLGKIRLPGLQNNPFRIISAEQFTLLLKANVFLSIGVAGLLLARFGPSIFSPEARFGVSAIENIVIESQLFAWAYLANAGKPRSKFTLLVLPISALSVLVAGYRNFFVFLLAIAIWGKMLMGLCTSTNYPFRTMTTAGITGILMFLGLVFVYRSENGTGLDVAGSISEHKLVASEYITPLVPLHLYAREGLGVAQVACERRGQIYDFFNPPRAFFQDLYTILPNQSLTFGQILGRVVNNNETSSLTVSLVGGITIAFERPYLFPIFLIFGALISFLWRTAYTNPNFVTIGNSVLFTVYFIGLAVKGYPKIAYAAMIFYMLAVMLFVRHPTQPAYSDTWEE